MMKRSLMLFLFSIFTGLALYAQVPNVKGRVSTKGEGLPGATVVVKGTTIGTTTDNNGNYSLSNVPTDAILQFNFVGMDLQEVSVGNKSTIDVVLSESTIGIDEVVVVGFGTQKKVNLTGAVGTVNSEKLEARPVQNATQMLQGLVSGLNITQSGGGSLDSRPSINIRGIATIGQGSTGNPLILIDGMEGDINALNPQDIDNISVLKDAAASSIYGSRAPFGVVLVTTKKGAEGKTVINYNNSFRWGSPIDTPDMMDSYTFATFFNDANVNSGAGPFFNETRMQRIKDYMDGKINTEVIANPYNPLYWSDGYGEGNANNDWYKSLYRDNSFSDEHNLSVSGGNKQLQYYISANYLDQDGLMVFNQDKFKRYTTTVKVQAQLTDWAYVNVSNRFVREDFGKPSTLGGGFYRDLARQGWPMLPLYDPNGFLLSSPSPALGLSDGGRYKSQNDWAYQQGQLVIEPIKGWKTTGELNYRVRNDFSHYDYQKTYNHDVNGNPYLNSTTSLVNEYAFRENYVNTNIYSEYTKEVGDGHNFVALVGFQSELSKYRNLSAQREGITVPSIPVLDATSGTNYKGETVAPVVGGQYQNWATQGFFGRLNYNFKERYLLETNLRYDGTSRFREDKRWNWFPSVSGGWNIAKEEFWKPFEHIASTLKIRASYGELGNQNTSDWYPTYVTMPVGTSNGSWLINGVKPNTSGAPGLVSESLTWERVQSWDLGADMAFFKGKLNASFDYYTRYTLDMVGPAPELPVILGTGVPRINNTDLKTYGFELDLNWKDRLKNGLGYGIRFMVSDAQTEITKYPNPTGSLSTYIQGRKLGEIWGYESIGIAKTQEEMTNHLATLSEGGQNAIGSQWEAGDIMYRDLNGDKKIDWGAWTEDNHGDVKVIGNNTARYPFSLDLNADWKGFDFRAFFQGIMQRDYFQSSYYFWGAYSWGIWWSTGLKQHEDYFRADANHPLGQNLDSYYARPLFSGKNQQTQTRFLQDASYIRLKNLQIGYTLPKSLTKRIDLEKVRIFASGENLWTGTRMTKIFDPETIQGEGHGDVYPLLRTISLGISVNY